MIPGCVMDCPKQLMFRFSTAENMLKYGSFPRYEKAAENKKRKRLFIFRTIRR